MEVTSKVQFPQTMIAGLYTKKDIDHFWDEIVYKQSKNQILKKLTREIIEKASYVGGAHDKYTFLTNERTIYMDGLMSPNFFLNGFVSTFGKVTYYLEKLGIYFAMFLLIKFLIDTVVVILRSLEIYHLTGRTMGFGRILLSATYNLLFLSIVTSMFDNHQDNKNNNFDDKNNNDNNDGNNLIEEKNKWNQPFEQAQYVNEMETVAEEVSQTRHLPSIPPRVPRGISKTKQVKGILRKSSHDSRKDFLFPKIPTTQIDHPLQDWTLEWEARRSKPEPIKPLTHPKQFTTPNKSLNRHRREKSSCIDITKVSEPTNKQIHISTVSDSAPSAPDLPNNPCQSAQSPPIIFEPQYLNL
jgi:hypothetical protein